MAPDTDTINPPSRAEARTRALSTDPARVLAELELAREQTLALVAGLQDEDLERVHSPIMSPLVWDLAHIAAYEDLWLAHRLSGLELLRPELAERYDAFETPRALRGDLALLGVADTHRYMDEVRDRAARAICERGVDDGVVCEMVIRHELQHTETMRQTLAIAGLLPGGEPPLEPIAGAPGWVEVPAGRFEMGAPAEGFAYDNERPRHPVELGGFRIARHPVSNESWTSFSEAGGYEKREWWSPDGWAWKQKHAVARNPAVAAGHPRAAACHVSWFEAEAFAAAHEARLPTEAEWERAARWTTAGAGEGADTEPAGGEQGVLGAVGEVWEWTQSTFRGYPGFRPHPYREYSEVFFGDSYRVLRGGSWATPPRVASVTFRNWDLPQRRQIFAGLRLARNVS